LRAGLAGLPAFRNRPWRDNLIGTSGLNVITRLMGLILAVIGVQMLIGGISGAIEMAK
jgi:small neutral amino acid transporter SnatA (MarC family)